MVGRRALSCVVRSEWRMGTNCQQARARARVCTRVHKIDSSPQDLKRTKAALETASRKAVLPKASSCAPSRRAQSPASSGSLSRPSRACICACVVGRRWTDRPVVPRVACSSLHNMRPAALARLGRIKCSFAANRRGWIHDRHHWHMQQTAVVQLLSSCYPTDHSIADPHRADKVQPFSPLPQTSFEPMTSSS